VRYDALVSEIAPDVPGCPDMAIERAVRDAAIEFFDQTACWRVDQEPVAVSAGTAVVELELPAGTRLVQLLRAKLGSRPLDRKSREDLLDRFGDFTVKGMPAAVTRESDTEIRLVPVPGLSMADRLQLHFAVTPTRASTSIPDEQGERHWQALVEGARAKLMAMLGQPWAQPKLASVARGAFEKAMREAMLTASQDAVAGTKRMKLRRRP